MSSEIHEVEQNFIYILLHHLDYVDKWSEGSVCLKHFHADYHMLINSIEDVYQDGELLTRKTFFKHISKIPIPNERIKQQRIFSQCFLSKANINDFTSLSDSIIDAYIARELGNSLEAFEIKRKKVRDSEAIHSLIDRLQDAVDTLKVGRTETIYEDIRGFFGAHKDYISGVRSGEITEPPKISCGIHEIDTTYTTGFAAGELFIICADVSCYKSSMMLNIATNVWKNGYDVLFVTLEMPEQQVTNRLMSMTSRIPLAKITNPKTMTDEEYDTYVKTQESLALLKTNMYILDMRNERTKVSAIQRIIDRQEAIFKPKLVVIDYLANLVPDKENRNRNDLEIGDMLKELRFLGKSRGFAVVSGAQIGREGLKRLRKDGVSKDKHSVHSEDLRNSHEIAADADYILAQFLNSTQPNKFLDICIVKNRNGAKVFEGGQVKASLELFPEIGLIKSRSESPLTGDLASEIFDITNSDEWHMPDEIDDIDDISDSENSSIDDNFNDFISKD